MLPLGCPGLRETPRLPVPAHALEVDFRHRGDGAPGVALALDFVDGERASAFLDTYAQALRACSGGRARPQTGGSAVEVLSSTSGVLVTRRVDDAAPPAERIWTELVTRGGSRVILVAANTSDPRTELDRAGLVSGLRTLAAG